jgi:hypothetical protein
MTDPLSIASGVAFQTSKLLHDTVVSFQNNTKVVRELKQEDLTEVLKSLKNEKWPIVCEYVDLGQGEPAIVAVPHVSRVANGKTDWWTAIHLISCFRAADYEDTQTGRLQVATSVHQNVFYRAHDFAAVT